VLPPVQGWVPLVLDEAETPERADELGAPHDLAPRAVLAANRTILVRYDWSSTYGANVFVFEGAELLAQICWPLEEQWDMEPYDASLLIDRGLIDAGAAAKLKALTSTLYPGGPPREHHRLAEAFGLPDPLSASFPPAGTRHFPEQE
jgi:hypothetical protein